MCPDFKFEDHDAWKLRNTYVHSGKGSKTITLEEVNEQVHALAGVLGIRKTKLQGDYNRLTNPFKKEGAPAPAEAPAEEPVAKTEEQGLVDGYLETLTNFLDMLEQMDVDVTDLRGLLEAKNYGALGNSIIGKSNEENEHILNAISELLEELAEKEIALNHNDYL